MDKSKGKGVFFHELICKVFEQGRIPEQLYRSCDGFFSLQRKTEQQLFEKACQIAIEYKNYHYPFLKNLLSNKMLEQLDLFDQEGQDKKTPDHENIRGKDAFS